MTDMSGFNLRTLLDGPSFALPTLWSAGAYQNVNLDSPDHQSLSSAQKLKSTDVSDTTDPSSAFLLNTNIWGNSSDNNDDFNLEYMDLDEFLTETGLGNAFPSTLQENASTSQSSPPHTPTAKSPTPEPVKTQTTSHLEALLRSTSPVLNNSETKQNQNVDKPQDTAEGDIIKKRKYADDGEGLTEASVVVVPGREGFDPAVAKFKPEELRPQPIIKKSKKTFVAESHKDDRYWKRRSKNNVAAKRSRDARRAKENQIIMRAGFLEDQNEELTVENKRLVKENKELREIIKRLKNTS